MNKFAVSATDIGDMIERDGSALAVANNTLAQSIALGTAMNETIQDAATSGTTLKVLSLRIRGVKTELEDMGEGTDGVVENTSKLEAQVKALTNVNGKGGVEIMADANNFKSTYQIIKEIGSVWKQMSDVNQAALLEVLAGNFARFIQKCIIRIYLIAGNSLEPFTTIMEKSHYESLKTKGLDVHATKYPNVFHRPYGTLVEGRRSTTIFMSRYELENKGGNPEYSYQ